MQERKRETASQGSETADDLTGRRSAAAALADLESGVALGRVVSDRGAKSEAAFSHPRGGGIPGARLAPRRRRPAKVGLGALVQRDVEVATSGGGRHRGELVGSDPDWLTLMRSGGRLVVLRVGAVVAVTEELEVPR